MPNMLHIFECSQSRMLYHLCCIFVLAVVMPDSDTNVSGIVRDKRGNDIVVADTRESDINPDGQQSGTVMSVPMDTRVSSEGSQDPSMACNPFLRTYPDS